MAEQEPYEEGEIAEVERDLERLEEAPGTETEQIDADEDEIREVELEPEDHVDVSDGDRLSAEDWFRMAETARGDEAHDVLLHYSNIGADSQGLDLSQLHAPEDEIENVEREL